MQRRKFIRESSFIAVGVGVFGSISFAKGQFIGDSPTTTDILGPFYRPNAPLKPNINPPGYSGKILHLSGTVYKEDGTTPYKDALVEIWQADETKGYDNTSDDFVYRGSQKAGKDGKYHFITAPPVPYAVGEALQTYRPAHIHMRVSGDGLQDLITQIYFKGDKYLEHDLYSSSKFAVNRILNVTQKNPKESTVEFNVVMSKEFKISSEAMAQIVGVYAMEDKSLVEFYSVGDGIFVKVNGQIIEGLSYTNNNTFLGGGNLKAKFEIQSGGAVKVIIDYPNPIINSGTHIEGVKTFKY